MTLPKVLVKEILGPPSWSEGCTWPLGCSTLEAEVTIDNWWTLNMSTKIYLEVQPWHVFHWMLMFSSTVLLLWKGNWAAIVLQLTCFPYQLMGIMMVPQFRFESTPWLQQHFLFFIIKSKRNHTHPLLESCQKQLTAILSGTKQALWDGFRPWHGRKWIRSIDGFGQGEAGDTTGIPIKLKNDIPSELKRSSLNSLLYHKTWSGIEDCQDSSKFKRQLTRHPLLLCHPAQPAHLTQLTMVAMTQLTPHPHLPAPLQQPTPRGPVQQVQWSKMSQLTWKH